MTISENSARSETDLHQDQNRVAVLIPCFNEAVAIANVVSAFEKHLPQARVYVYDNNSSDDTTAVAAKAGAIVRHEALQGKGHVVRRMFADIEADIYVLVDGDDTYDATSAPEMVTRLVNGQLDLVNTSRITEEESAYRPGHRLGNWAFSAIIAAVFGRRITDVLSGYRALSHRFVKSFPALSRGFDIETELAVHALELQMPITEIESRYRPRPKGSTSKLNTYRDGFRILLRISSLVRHERPLAFFSTVGAGLALVSVALALPLLPEYLVTGLVPRFPTAILSTGLMIVAFLSFACGLILNSVAYGRRELRRLRYLAFSAPSPKRSAED